MTNKNLIGSYANDAELLRNCNLTSFITLHQIEVFLSKTYDDVQLIEIDANRIFRSEDARTMTVLNYEGFDLMIGVYLRVKKYHRYMYCPQTKQAYKF